jgi:ABC-type sugar transport system substrate-binding protein
MTRSLSLSLIALLIATGLTAGCGDTVSVPPVDSGSILKRESSPEPTSDVPTVALLLPDGQDLDSSIWEQFFRIHAADRRVFVEVLRSPEGHQAEQIAELPSRGIAAAVIVPDTKSDDLAPAIRAVIDQGIPIVFLDRGVAGLDPSPPVVRFSPVEDDARAVVAAAVEDARKAGFPEDAEAVIVTNGPFDAAGRARVAALEAALAETSLKALPTIHFQGYIDAVRPLLEPLVKEHPNLAIIFTEEEQAATAAVDGRNVLYGEQPDRRPYLVAGFGYREGLIRMAETNQFAALAQRNPERVARRAFDIATALARGEQKTLEPVVATVLSRATSSPDRSEYEAMKAMEKLQAVPTEGGPAARRRVPL